MRKISLKYRIGLFLIFLLLGYSVFFFFSKSKTKTLISDLNFSPILKNLPAQLNADNKQVFIIPSSPNCILKINSAWGTKAFSLEKEVILSKDIISDAGEHSLSVWCNFQKVESKTLSINSLGPNGTIESYIGSKSIPADNGLHWSMFTILPVDEFNNMVINSTKLVIKELRPNGEFVVKNVKTKDGIGFTKITSKTMKGKTLISTSSGSAYSKEKELLELPNFPKNIFLKPESDILYADSRQFFKLITNELFDNYGNRVSDGTLIKFKVVDSKGNQSFYRTFSMDGLASVNIQNPDNPGNLSVLGYIDNLVYSQALNLNFKPYVTNFNLQFIDNKEYLLIGPVIGPLNQLVSDGKEANILFTKAKTKKTGIIREGKTKVEMPKIILKGEKIIVSIGGMQKDINF